MLIICLLLIVQIPCRGDGDDLEGKLYHTTTRRSWRMCVSISAWINRISDIKQCPGGKPCHAK